MIKRLIHEPKPDREFKGWSRFLFTCEDIEPDVAIKRWLELWTQLRPAIGTLLGQVYSTGSYLQEKAFAVAVAAEAIHTKLYDHPQRSPESFTALMASMLQGVADKSDQQWIKARFSNTLSFKARMNELSDKPDARAVGLLIPDKRAWLDFLYKNRNLIAHGKDDKQPTHLEWLIMMRETSYLLYLVLMQELGISGDRQLKAVEDERMLNFLRSQRTVHVTD